MQQQLSNRCKTIIVKRAKRRQIIDALDRALDNPTPDELRQTLISIKQLTASLPKNKPLA